MASPKRFYPLAIAVTIVIGLGSRAYAGPGATFIHTYVGDVLYATMYYWLFRWIVPLRTKQWAAMWALILCFLIEIGQLYHTPWIDGIRTTRLGGLILGFGFLWSDLVCYTLGVLLGWGLDHSYRRVQPPNTRGG